VIGTPARPPAGPGPSVPIKPRLDWFPAALAGAAGLAWLLPWIGARGGPLHPEVTGTIGVALIFFLAGVALPLATVRANLVRWRLHALIQGCTFVLFPALGSAMWFASRGWLADDLRLGVVFLCVLPSTVSSAVALTAAAHGNVALAVVNATISSLLGVALTPLWLGLVSTAGGATVPVGAVILDLLRWLVLPLVAGQVARPFLAAMVARHRGGAALVDRMVILFLVYASFCDAARGGVWSQVGAGALGALVVLGGALFALTAGSMHVAGRHLGLSRGDRIAAILVGSTKSLATGVPMAQLIFPGRPGLGLVLLPIIVYHPLQLLIAGALASRWSGRWAEDPGSAAAPPEQGGERQP
jgi:sodium/bile acid cotransporter 7